MTVPDITTLRHLVFEQYNGETTPPPPPQTTTDTPDSIQQPQSQPEPNGSGIATFFDGHTYQGEFRKGFMEGKGRFTWLDGATYLGEFKKNRMNGLGSYVWTNGSRYEGSVKNGVREGKGTFLDGKTFAAYSGEWMQGSLNGSGILYYNKERTCFYEGEWKNGQKHGKGRMQYASGNVYEGEWRDNVKHGFGTMKWVDRNQEYTGEWKNGLRSGKGIYVWKVLSTSRHHFPMHNFYDGEWLEGKRNGFGIYQFSTGARYEGQWKDDFKDGFGFYVTDNGRKYVGHWVNDKMVEPFEHYDNELPFYFPIESRPPNTTTDSQRIQLRQLNQVFLRHISPLRQIYQRYCSKELSTQEDNPKVMTRFQFWNLLKDCQFLSRGFTLAELDRAIGCHYKSDQVFQIRYQNPHNMNETIIFHDFLEFLVHIARHVYGSRTDLAVHETPLTAALSHLIKTDLLPRALSAKTSSHTDTVTGDETYRMFTKSLEKEVHESHYQAFLDIYEKIAYVHGTSLPDSMGDKALTLHDVLLFLHEAKLFDDKRSGYTVTKMLSHFATVIPKLHEDGVYDLEYELTSVEFYELIQSIIFAPLEPKLERIVKPLLAQQTQSQPLVITLDMIRADREYEQVFEGTLLDYLSAGGGANNLDMAAIAALMKPKDAVSPVTTATTTTTPGATPAKPTSANRPTSKEAKKQSTSGPSVPGNAKPGTTKEPAAPQPTSSNSKTIAVPKAENASMARSASLMASVSVADGGLLSAMEVLSEAGENATPVIDDVRKMDTNLPIPGIDGAQFLQQVQTQIREHVKSTLAKITNWKLVARFTPLPLPVATPVSEQSQKQDDMVESVRESFDEMGSLKPLSKNRIIAGSFERLTSFQHSGSASQSRRETLAM